MLKEQQKLGDDFGRMLKRLRKERGLSLEELAKMTGISASYLNRLERSKRKSPAFPKILVIAEALGVEPWMLAGSKLYWNKAEPIGIRELLSNHQVHNEGKLLTLDEKEVLVEIIECVLNAEFSKESILRELQEIGDLIIELKEHQ